MTNLADLPILPVTLEGDQIVIDSKPRSPQSLRAYAIRGDSLVLLTSAYKHIRCMNSHWVWQWLEDHQIAEDDSIVSPLVEEIEPVNALEPVESAPVASTVASAAITLEPDHGYGLQPATNLVSYVYDFGTNTVNLAYETVLPSVTNVTKLEGGGVHIAWNQKMAATADLLLQLHHQLVSQASSAEAPPAETPLDAP